MVHVHLVRGEVAHAPVAPGRAPFLHSPAKPRGSVPAARPSSPPRTSGTDTRPSLVRPVVRVAASAVRRGLGAVDTAHVRPLVVVLVLLCERPDGQHAWTRGQRAQGNEVARRPGARWRWVELPEDHDVDGSRYPDQVPIGLRPAPDSNRGTLRVRSGSSRGGRYRAPLAVGSAGVKGRPGAHRRVGTTVGTARSCNPVQRPVRAVTGGRCGPRVRCLTTPAATLAGAWCTGNAEKTGTRTAAFPLGREPDTPVRGQQKVPAGPRGGAVRVYRGPTRRPVPGRARRPWRARPGARTRPRSETSRTGRPCASSSRAAFRSEYPRDDSGGPLEHVADDVRPLGPAGLSALVALHHRPVIARAQDDVRVEPCGNSRNGRPLPQPTDDAFNDLDRVGVRYERPTDPAELCGQGGVHVAVRGTTATAPPKHHLSDGSHSAGNAVTEVLRRCRSGVGTALAIDVMCLRRPGGTSSEARRAGVDPPLTSGLRLDVDERAGG